jgi:hypothetical protein
VVEFDWRRVAASPTLWGFIGFTVGSSVIWLPMLAGLSLFGSLFKFIIATIGFAFTLRSLVGWLALLGIVLVGIAGLTGRDLRGKPYAQHFNCFTAFVIGWALSRAAIYFLLDAAFFRGSVVTLPFVLGVILLAGIVGHSTVNPLFFRNEDGSPRISVRAASLASVLAVALLLTLPNLTAVAGLQAYPPEKPSTGYGSGDSPYEVAEFSFYTNYPEEMTSWWDDWAWEQDWKVYVFVPVGVTEESVGVAVLLHGYQGEKIEFYRDTLVSLAGQGLVAIFPQYVSDMDLSSVPAGFELNYILGGSDHPQHLPRYTMALAGVDAGFDFISGDAAFRETLGGAEVDTDHLWIGGHSMGAGTTFYVMSELLERGMGSESLVVDLEAPWIHATQPELMGNMSLIPDHALIHVVEYETELVVDKCIGRWQHARLWARDSALSLPAEQVLFLQVQTDFHGFPRLMASHYLPAAIIRDSLADHSYYPRIEAQADYIASSAADDEPGAQEAKSWFMTEGEMTDLGEWSDGVAVKPILIIDSPLEIDDGAFEECPTSPAIAGDIED